MVDSLKTAKEEKDTLKKLKKGPEIKIQREGQG